MSLAVNTQFITTAVTTSAKVLLVCAFVWQSSGFGAVGTYAAWQVETEVTGNLLSTAELEQSQENIVVEASDLVSNKASEQANPTGWFFYNDENDTINNTLGTFVDGPGSPLVGSGSAEISVSGSQRRNLATYLFAGTKLSTIKTLTYSTYNPAAGNGGSANRSAYLNFNVTFDGVDTWQSRLLYVPANNGPVQQNTWQDWDAINEGDALWGWSRFANGPDDIAATVDDNTWPDGNTNALRTWDDLLTAFPNIAIRTNDGWLGLRVGEPYTNGYTENIDSFSIGIRTGFTEYTVTYDFEPTAPIDTFETVVVSEDDMQNWVFAPENTVGGQTGELVAGPSIPPLGMGSAELALTASNEGQILVTNTYAGTRLSDIETLTYSTYRVSGDSATAPALSFEFDNDITDVDSGFRGRMTYEPYHTQTVETGVWHEWDTLDGGAGSGTGNWWGSPNSLSTLDEACPQSNPCTWSEVLALYPNAGIRDTGSPFAGLLLFKVGSNWNGFVGNVDNFVIGISTGSGVATTQYDFEGEPGALLAGTSLGDVVINEIMWTGSETSSNDEWIELRNMTNEDIDVTGWTIENAGTGSSPTTTIPSGVLPAEGYFLISNFAATSTSSALNDSIVVDYVTTGIELLNTGEVLTLRNSSGMLIDETPAGSWAAGTNIGTTSKSMERNMVPGDGTLISSWHTCVDTGCTATTFWDTAGENYGTPRAENLSENDPTVPHYIDQDWSHTVGSGRGDTDDDHGVVENPISTTTDVVLIDISTSTDSDNHFDGPTTTDTIEEPVVPETEPVVEGVSSTSSDSDIPEVVNEEDPSVDESSAEVSTDSIDMPVGVPDEEESGRPEEIPVEAAVESVPTDETPTT